MQKQTINSQRLRWLLMMLLSPPSAAATSIDLRHRDIWLLKLSLPYSLKK